MKPGVKTSEFWVALLIILTSVGAAFFLFCKGSGWIAHISGSISLIVAFLKAHYYEINRVKQKLEDLFSHQDPAPTPAPCPTPTPPPPAPPASINLPTPLNEGDDIDLVIDYRYFGHKPKPAPCPPPPAPTPPPDASASQAKPA